MFVNIKRAQKIFRGLSPLDYEIHEGGNMTVFGNEFTYEIKKSKEGFVILAQKEDAEKPLELFAALYQFKDLDGENYRVSNPYFMFNTADGAYYITVRKQILVKEVIKEGNGFREGKTFWKTVKYYNFQIK